MTMDDKRRNADEPNWGLFYDDSKKNLSARKSIKVKIPIRQHIKLHALKLFSENNISETVEHALDLYFERMQAQELAAAGGELPPSRAPRLPDAGGLEIDLVADEGEEE